MAQKIMQWSIYDSFCVSHTFAGLEVDKIVFAVMKHSLSTVVAGRFQGTPAL